MISVWNWHLWQSRCSYSREIAPCEPLLRSGKTMNHVTDRGSRDAPGVPPSRERTEETYRAVGADGTLNPRRPKTRETAHTRDRSNARITHKMQIPTLRYTRARAKRRRIVLNRVRSWSMSMLTTDTSPGPPLPLAAIHVYGSVPHQPPRLAAASPGPRPHPHDTSYFKHDIGGTGARRAFPTMRHRSCRAYGWRRRWLGAMRLVL